MKKLCFLFFLTSATTVSFAQKETFDITNYTPPQGWKKEVKANVTSYQIVSQQKKTWCQLGVYRSFTSKGTIDQDFESEWQELVASVYKNTDTPQVAGIPEINGWKIKSGGSKFAFNNGDALVMLTSYSGYGKVVSIIATTNSKDYITDIQKFIASVELSKPDSNAVSLNKTPVNNTAMSAGTGLFTFTTTNFDDGWTSTVQENWVQVMKGNTKVLIHYSNAKADAYNSVLKESDYNAWNILVAPRYSNLKNFEWKTIQSWQSITFMQADATENATGKTVHIVLFKEHYSNGSGSYLEFITDSKAAYESEFGPYHNTEFDWDKTANMQGRNKFAIAAADFKGTWTNDFTGIQQYVNVYTGASAGMSSYSSKQVFEFGSGNKYNWQITVASGMTGNIKFQNVKSNGSFSVLSNWQLKFSDIEGKPKTFDAYFTAVKGGRILWLSDITYPGYTAYGKSN